MLLLNREQLRVGAVNEQVNSSLLTSSLCREGGPPDGARGALQGRQGPNRHHDLRLAHVQVCSCALIHNVRHRCGLIIIISCTGRSD